MSAGIRRRSELGKDGFSYLLSGRSKCFECAAGIRSSKRFVCPSWRQSQNHPRASIRIRIQTKSFNRFEPPNGVEARTVTVALSDSVLVSFSATLVGSDSGNEVSVFGSIVRDARWTFVII